MSTRNFIYFYFFEKITCFACLIGSRLNYIFQFKPQSRLFVKSLFSLGAETLALFTTEKRQVLSANNLTSVVRPKERRLM